METRYTVIIERINEGLHQEPVLTIADATGVEVNDDGDLKVRGVNQAYGCDAGLWIEVRIIRKTVMTQSREETRDEQRSVQLN